MLCKILPYLVFLQSNLQISHHYHEQIIESRDKTEDGVGGSSCDAVRVSVLV